MADLQKLSREEKFALLDALEEKTKRIKKKRSPYSPNELQDQVHRSQKRIRFVAAGNGAGKTSLAVQEAYWAATGTHPHRTNLPVPNSGIILLDSPDKVKDRYLEELAKWYDMEDWQLLKNGKPYINEIILPNGSSIKFMFHLQEPMAFESIEASYLVADEPSPRPVWVALQRGLRAVTGAWSLMVGTPLAQPWIKKEIWDPWARGERDDIECFRAGVQVNVKNLGKDFITNFSKDLTDHEKQVRLYGNFAHLEGLALADLWDRNVHMVPSHPWPRHAPCVLAVDCHPAKAHHALLLGVNRYEQFFVIKTLKSKESATEFGKLLKEFVNGFNVVEQVCDSLGASPTSGGDGRRSFIDVVNSQGMRLRSTTFKEKSEDIWVQDIRDLLKVRKNNFGQDLPGLFVYENNLELINEFESVMWKRNRHDEITKGVLDIANKDYLSCLKYALAASPRYNGHREIHRRKAATSYGMRRKTK